MKTFLLAAATAAILLAAPEPAHALFSAEAAERGDRAGRASSAAEAQYGRLDAWGKIGNVRQIAQTIGLEATIYSQIRSGRDRKPGRGNRSPGREGRPSPGSYDERRGTGNVE